MNKRNPYSSDLLCDVVCTPLGHLHLTYILKGNRAESVYLTGVSFNIPGKSAALACHGTSPAITARKSPLPEYIRDQMMKYFEGKLRKFDIPFILSGTDFEKRVWLTLNEVSYGQTRTYKWLAERLGSPRSVRAVGQALGKNPLPIILPCHRIIQSDGKLGGYSSGVGIKRRLLDLEYYSSP
ncbi:Methylated-DNA--protein-cysteine methyltransferase [hydrothermal vent metagenome]|uniref:methylated-DNA--[protein]-cysteine S-methyltransferase n=1 Tax=hydrothermal vent metagenome TaxID=652676 RepID=A0A3B1DSL6_9ZZZZ